MANFDKNKFDDNRFDMKKITSILFDLDGTLSDPKEGIIRCLGYALEKLGLPIPQEKDLLWCIGPPLRGSMEKLAGSELADEGLRLYRERFRTKGKYENNVYEGIPEILEELKQNNYNLYVATSKPHVYAKDILDRFGLTHYFKQIYGPELDGTRNDKAELIDYLLDKEGLLPHETVMIGDRSFDIVAAKANNVKSIGVTYGYGNSSELLESGADLIIDQPQTLTDIFSK